VGVPQYAFELMVYLNNGRGIQTPQFQTIATAMEAVRSLRPTQAYGWRLSLVIDAGVFPRQSRRFDATAAEISSGK
jgi:hypothetical protein